MITRVKGTQDFLDLTLFNFVISQAKKQLATYHFTEIAVPILESVALFKRSLGAHTDVVSKEMFLITPHHENEEEEICLRPEATASIVRAFVENNVQELPWRVFTWGPMFRYERPQKGRYRQFNQLSVEIIGAHSVMYDAEFIKMLDRFFHERLLFNNYALLINYLGCADDRASYEKVLKTFLDKHAAQLCSLCQLRKEKNILRVFDCKTASCQTLYESVPVITDALCNACAQEWLQLRDMLQLLSVSFTVRPTLVRGLDYYNKTVFEFVSDALGSQNAFCAGGRYDSLVAQLGGKQDQPSIGAAIGIERLTLILEQVSNGLPLPQLRQLTAILPLSAAQQGLALLLADQLQAQDIAVQVFLDGDSVKSMMRKANKLGATYCVLIGDEEQQTRTVTLKNLLTGAQEKVAQTDLVKMVK